MSDGGIERKGHVRDRKFSFSKHYEYSQNKETLTKNKNHK
jgi:hypothetical protein